MLSAGSISHVTYSGLASTSSTPTDPPVSSASFLFLPRANFPLTPPPTSASSSPFEVERSNLHGCISNKRARSAPILQNCIDKLKKRKLSTSSLLPYSRSEKNPNITIRSATSPVGSATDSNPSSQGATANVIAGSPLKMDRISLSINPKPCMESSNRQSVNKNGHIDPVKLVNNNETIFTGLYLDDNPRTKSTPQLAKQRRLKQYSFEDKLDIVDLAHAIGNRAAGRHFDVAESSIREWRKHENKLRSQVADNLDPKKIDVSYPWVQAEIDNELLNHISQNQHTNDVDWFHLEELAKNIWLNIYTSGRIDTKFHQSSGLKITLGWVARFMERHKNVTTHIARPVIATAAAVENASLSASDTPDNLVDPAMSNPSSVSLSSPTSSSETTSTFQAGGATKRMASYEVAQPSSSPRLASFSSIAHSTFDAERDGPGPSKRSKKSTSSTKRVNNRRSPFALENATLNGIGGTINRHASNASQVQLQAQAQLHQMTENIKELLLKNFSPYTELLKNLQSVATNAAPNSSPATTLSSSRRKCYPPRRLTTAQDPEGSCKAPNGHEINEENRTKSINGTANLSFASTQQHSVQPTTSAQISSHWLQSQTATLANASRSVKNYPAAQPEVPQTLQLPQCQSTAGTSISQENLNTIIELMRNNTEKMHLQLPNMASLLFRIIFNNAGNMGNSSSSSFNSNSKD